MNRPTPLSRGRSRNLAAWVFCWALLLFGGCGSSGDPVPAGPSGDYEGLREPTQPYGVMVDRVAGFLMQDKGTGGIRQDQGRDVPPYFYSFGICDRRDPDFGCEAADQLTRAISFPAFTCSVAIEAFLRYYVYSGNEEARDRAVAFADWVLDHLTPAADLLGGLPYSTQVDGSMGGAVDGSGIELDKAALFALGLLKLHDATEAPRFFDAARHIAEQLLSVQKDDGSWAFRVGPSTGDVFQDYTSHQIPFVRLLAEMARRTGVDAFLAASERAWAWILENPVTTHYWANFYEDMDDPDSLVNFDTLETIRELVARSGGRPEYLAAAEENFAWIERTFLILGAPYPPMIPTIAEQTGFVDWDGNPVGTTSSTAQWASVGLDLYRALPAPRTLRHALEAANVTASVQQEDGRMFTVTADANGLGLYPITWYEQCFVPLWSLLEIMEKIPEAGPAGETRMLRYSSPIREIRYGQGGVRYRTGGPGAETLKVRGKVLRVEAGGRTLRPGLLRDAETAGWSFDPETGLLHVRHAGSSVQVFLAE